MKAKQMDNKIVNQVMVTSDYSKFSVTPENRGVVQSHVGNLARSMAKHGWIDGFPMIVSRIRGKLQIRDGQNRFWAAQRLGIPVKYLICEKGQDKIPIAELNGDHKNWTTADFCKSYANQGDRDYEILINFVNDEGVGFTAATCLLSQGAPAPRTIKNGNFKVVDVRWAKRNAAHLRRLKKVMPWRQGVHFVRVFVKACKVPSFDPERLIKQIEKHPEKCVQMATEVGLAGMFEDLYNFRSRNPIPLAYEIRQVSIAHRADQIAQVKARQRATVKR